MDQQDRHIVELDVRQMLKENKEPFRPIMNTVKSLQPDDLFILRATFNPIPLHRVMKRKGFKKKAIQVEKKHWEIHYWKESDND